MKLRHYTNSKEAALSILRSKQLWLGKTGEALKDKDEINHFIKIFRFAHAFKDIQNKLKITVPPLPQISLYESLVLSIYHEYFLIKNNCMIGDVFAEVIRNESYIICFTKENDSTFHDSKYGPISLVFSKNPLQEEKYSEFKFLTREITYIRFDEFSKLDIELNKFFEEGLAPFLAIIKDLEYHKSSEVIGEIIRGNFDKKESKKARKNIITTGENLIMNTSHDMDTFYSIIHKFQTNNNLDQDKISEIGSYLEDKINKVRETKILGTFEPRWVGRHRLKGTFKNLSVKGHKGNIMSCFLKDIRDENDNETRIIALPTSEYINNDNKLKVDLNMTLLEKVIVSQEIEERDTVIKEIKSTLRELGLNQVRIE